MLTFYDFGAAIPAPSFVALGTGDVVNSGTTLAPNYPAGLAADDILLLTVFLANDIGVSSVADAGFAPILVVDNAVLYWKRATGSESGTTTVTLGSAATIEVAAYITAWRGCVASGDPFERANYYEHIATTAVRGKGLRTAGTNRCAASFTWRRHAASGTNDGSWTEEAEQATAAVNLAVSSLAVPAAGRVEPNRRTTGNSAAAYTFTLALVPVGGTPGAADSFADIVLQLQFAGMSNGSTAFDDESYYDFPITVAGDAQAQSGKLELDGTGDWIYPSNTYVRRDLLFADYEEYVSEDFTIDAFGVQVDTIASQQPICTLYNNNTNNRGFLLAISATTGNVFVQYSTSGTSGSTVTPINYAAGITAGSTHDYRVVRSVAADEVYLYIDGVKVATGAWADTANVFDSTANFVLGAYNIAATPTVMNGRMAAFRFTKSALTTAASYTVETLPLAT